MTDTADVYVLWQVITKMTEPRTQDLAGHYQATHTMFSCQPDALRAYCDVVTGQCRGQWLTIFPTSVSHKEVNTGQR